MQAVTTVMKPLLDNLAGVGQGAGQAEAALRGVVRWARWRLLGWIVAAGAALVLAGWLAGLTVLWWDERAVDTARAQLMVVKEEIALSQGEVPKLQAQIVALRDNYDGWVKIGALAKVIQCGPKSRACVAVNEGAGGFTRDGQEYRGIQGY